MGFAVVGLGVEGCGVVGFGVETGVGFVVVDVTAKTHQQCTFSFKVLKKANVNHRVLRYMFILTCLSQRSYHHRS